MLFIYNEKEEKFKNKNGGCTLRKNVWKIKVI